MQRPADAAAPHVELQACKASLLVNDTGLSTANQDALCGAAGWSMAAHHNIWQFASGWDGTCSPFPPLATWPAKRYVPSALCKPACLSSTCICTCMAR
jgi:hypothetical protein